MQSDSYEALVIEELDSDNYSKKVRAKNIAELPEGDVLIRVHYSSLNYKDALSASGNRGVTRRYPHVPGIDAAGVVEESSSPDFKAGDQVIASGFDIGMNTSGGFGQYIRVPAGWTLHCPQGLTLRESMIYGTAGFTAAQSVERLVTFPVLPESGNILVTGATGGVGSIAIALLSRLKYRVTAVSGKPEAEDFLIRLGAEEIISRKQATDLSGKLLLREKWAGVIDTVGGEILATAIKSTAYGGAVTCCGNVASPDLPLSVYPFILRAVSLLGIDSAKCPIHLRQKIWQRLAGEWRIESLDSLVTECNLPELPDYIEHMLQGRQIGRVIVNLL
ncbi:MAG: YhdH/YhfP family quinone oxidoreductase [Deltaproteobacteria bacterium]|nr:MAG: YhdH/YhfP family quinone oxidoreductase [Deltaproteobacteria bacterium]